MGFSLTSKYSDSYCAEILLKLQEQEAALLNAPVSSRRRDTLEQVQGLVHRVKVALCASPRGTAHYILSQAWGGRKIEFPDGDLVRRVKIERSLSERFGEPDNLRVDLTDEVAVELTSEALESNEAKTFLTQVCITVLLEGKDLPLILRYFVAMLLTEPPSKSRPGRRKTTNEERDKFIATLGEALKQLFGLPLSRGYGSSNDSCCSIIAETMADYGFHMTEDAIRKVIERGGPLIPTPFLEGNK